MNNFKLLIFVDDDLASNYYHEYILKDSEIVDETKSFISSIDALKYLQNTISDATKKLPDLIFLDLNIPEINGWDFVKEFVKIDLKKHPKIVLLSNSSNPKDKLAAENCNEVLELINKPLTIEYLESLRFSLNSPQ